MSKVMKERPVGTVFNWHGKRLKVVKDTDTTLAHNGCVFAVENCLSHYNCVDVPCLSIERNDKKNVHFIEVK